MREPEDLYGDLVPIIEDVGATWAIAGALAAMQYRASSRITTDADLLVSWIPGLEEAIQSAGWATKALADPGDPPHLIRARRGDNRVDLLIALTSYQQEALRRAQVNDRALTLEDVLVHKIIAWRTRDRNDIASILHMEPRHEVDWDYVAHWVAYFGFEERLSQVRPG